MLALRYLPDIAACVLFFLLSTQGVGGAIFAVLELGLVGVLVATNLKQAFETVLRWWPLLLTPLFAMTSSIWSSVPDVSIRYASQLLFTVFTGVLLARIMSPQRLLAVIMVSTFAFCIACVASRREGVSDVGMVLIGLTGSKNAMSSEAQLLFLSGLAVVLMRDAGSPLRLLGLLALPFGVVLLYMTHSATGVLMAIGGGGLLLALWFSERMTPGARLAMVLLTALVLAPLLMLLPEISLMRDHFLYETLNKDPTLTGRTLLWARADDLIAHKPWFGYGYQAIWMGDSSDTIGLMRLTGISDGRAFHFHNTFRQVAVDTGLVGLAIFVGTLLFTVLRGFAQALLRPTVATSFFFTSFLLSCLVAFGDTVLQPFLSSTVFLYACATFANWRPEKAGQPQFSPQMAQQMRWRAQRPA